MSSVLAKSKHGSLHHEIVCCSRTPIKNRLVEQAARAYLQPTLVKHTKVSQFSTKHWQMFIKKIAISFSFKNLFGPPIQACASLFSGLHFPDLPEAVTHLLGSLRPRFSGVLKS
ncbi:hypothetical protein O6H91_05G013900 [Diphasiastrum complanatum]|nr:hypothetical protein O6H91_05G013900 [Diphasiastrum complanatum]